MGATLNRAYAKEAQMTLDDYVSPRSGIRYKVLDRRKIYLECDGFCETGELCCFRIELLVQSSTDKEPFWLSTI